MPEKGWLSDVREISKGGMTFNDNFKGAMLLFAAFLVSFSIIIIYAIGLNSIEEIIKYYFGSTISIVGYKKLVAGWFFLTFVIAVSAMVAAYLFLTLSLIRCLELAITAVLLCCSDDFQKYYSMEKEFLKSINLKRMKRKLYSLFVCVVLVALIVIFASILRYDIARGEMLFWLLCAMPPIALILHLIYYRQERKYFKKHGNINDLYLLAASYTSGVIHFVSLWRNMILVVLFAVTIIPAFYEITSRSIRFGNVVTQNVVSDNVAFSDLTVQAKLVKKSILTDAQNSVSDLKWLDELSKNQYLFRYIYELIVIFALSMGFIYSIKKYLLFKKLRKEIRKKLWPALVGFVFSASITLVEKYVFDGQNMPFWFGLSFTSSLMFFASLNTREENIDGRLL